MIHPLPLSEILIAVVVAVCTMVIQYSFRGLKKKMDEERSKERRDEELFVVLRQAVIADLYDKLDRFTDFYISTWEITNNEFDKLSELFHIYTKLGGNHKIIDRFNLCKEIPRVSQRTKFNPYYTERRTEVK